jgi:cytochrome b subunit of formate dehydrogenase
VQKVTSKDGPHRKEFAVNSCGRCHGDVQEHYMKSDHGAALAAGVKDAPTCIDCHGEHATTMAQAEESRTSHGREAAMCLGCHLDNADVRARVGPSAKFVAGYENSVHGKAVREGNGGAATCSDCHGAHDMKKGSNPASSVSRKNTAATCGKCHADVQETYLGSIHGAKLMGGVDASASCTDCHGEHEILSPKDARSPVAARNVSVQVCSPCHASVRLTSKYDLAADRFRSFDDSYHGLAGRGGSAEAANCASCHGWHDIKPSTDSTSRIHKSNLAATCGSCHPGANVNFTKGSVHVLATESDNTILYWVSNGYIALIATLIGSMLLHNALDFRKKAKIQLAMRRGEIHRHDAPHRLYLRMSLNERIQHGTLVVSFFLLVLTGFALRFPDAWWVAPWRTISPGIFELRSLLHRVAGVMMLAASVYHVWYLAATPRGRQLFRDLLPMRKDVTDALGMMRYNLGFAKEKPLLDRFSYVEKAEYWALVWGTVVMAATGFILWFDNTFLGLLTKTGWDVARTVHYYEAWLATLAIIVWHFYFVIFNPNTYPINLAFWKGTLTEEEMADEHPLELERLRGGDQGADGTPAARRNGKGGHA